VPAFWVKLVANDLNCVDVALNATHSLIQKWQKMAAYMLDLNQKNKTD